MSRRKATQSVRLEITSLAKGGDGVAHVDEAHERRAVFVPRSAPGDLVEADVDFSTRPARAVSQRLLVSSPLRATPPCPFVGQCGGCDFMHLTVTAQRDAHREHVVAALSRVLGEEMRFAEVRLHAAPNDIGYRTRARLSVRSSGGRAHVGYREPKGHNIAEIASCMVLDPRLDALLPQLRELFQGERGAGELSIALGGGNLPVLELHWEEELSGGFFSRLSKWVEAGALAGAEVWLEGAREAARVGNPNGSTTAAGGGDLLVPSGGFAQAHPAMNRILGERILATFDFAGRDVVELYAGSGNFTVLLARLAKSVVAVESDARAVVAARSNLAARELRARVVCADAADFEIPAPARAVLLDPPRAGAPAAIERVAASRAELVAYVSCDATTLARDSGVLAGAGFRLTALEIFEMFPHTSHVETLAVFARHRRGKPAGRPA